jgi:hypothetical protein
VKLLNSSFDAEKMFSLAERNQKPIKESKQSYSSFRLKYEFKKNLETLLTKLRRVVLLNATNQAFRINRQ